MDLHRTDDDAAAAVVLFPEMNLTRSRDFTVRDMIESVELFNVAGLEPEIFLILLRCQVTEMLYVSQTPAECIYNWMFTATPTVCVFGGGVDE